MGIAWAPVAPEKPVRVFSSTCWLQACSLKACFYHLRAKIIETVLALRTTLYLKNERDYMPWESAINNLDFFYLMFDRSEVYGPLQVSCSCPQQV